MGRLSSEQGEEVLTNFTQERLPFSKPAVPSSDGINPESQEGRILKYLRGGNRITALEALDKFQCMRLGAVIFTLKKKNFKIEDKFVETNSGKHVKQYWLSDK